MATGPLKLPASEIQETPVISPLPFCEKRPAATGSAAPAWPRGWMPVTPVRTESPSIRVVQPTSIPGTSVIAFQRPGIPPNGMPSERARGLPAGVAACGPGRPPAAMPSAVLADGGFVDRGLPQVPRAAALGADHHQRVLTDGPDGVLGR